MCLTEPSCRLKKTNFSIHFPYLAAGEAGWTLDNRIHFVEMEAIVELTAWINASE